jgi:heat shock protein HslJ
MHRTRALLALPLLVLALAACSSSSGASAPAPSAPATLPGTIWTVVSVGGEFVDATNPPTMDFAADGALSGTTGCNQFSGTYTVDGSKLTVSPLTMTMMLCEGPVGDGEALFAPAIQGATAWAIDADGNLLLSGAGDILAKPSGG